MNKLPTIVLGYGSAAVINIDLTDADMTRGKVVLSIRETGSKNVIVTQEYTTAAVHSYTFDDDFTKTNRAKSYEYDLMQIVSGERYRLTEIGMINVVDTVGGH